MMGDGDVVSTNTAASGVECDRLFGKRISFNDSDSSGHLPSSSSLPAKKRFKSDVEAIEDQPSPGINDVLLGKGSACFDHIGNRRFRVLVEVNVDSFFDGDVASSKVDASSRTSKQDDVIDNIMSSIQGNRPSGKFLLPIGKSEEECSSDLNSSLNGMTWRVASNEEARQKVHDTFLAAGRFFMKRDHIFDKIKRLSQVDGDGEDCAQLNDNFGSQSNVELECSRVQADGTKACQVDGKTPHALINEKTGSTCSSVQAEGTKACQADAETPHVLTKEKTGIPDVDEATRNACKRSPVSASRVTPFALNQSQPSSFSRILHSSISQQLCFTNGLRNNYIPAMVSSFQSIPIEEFFMPDERDSPSTAEEITHPAAFVVPSNYDVLCGPGQAFFHHIGNRRFRILIEMNMERYEQEYQKVGRGENFAIHEIVSQILESIANRCDPKGRFLAMDMQTGWWRVLSPMYSQLKVEQTLYQCMQVKQTAEKQHNLALEVARQKEQLAAAMLFSPVSSLSEEKAAPSFYQNNMFEMGNYKPKRKRKKSTSLANGQDKPNIFFPAGLGDKDDLIRAQDNAKKALQRKSTSLNSSEVNERGCDSKGADDSSSVLDAVSGMITLSRRGSTDA